MVKIAMLSEWHVHAKGYARQILEHPNAEISVVWDENSHRGQQWAQELSVPFEKDLAQVLSRNDVDAVVVNTATNLHKDVIIAAAKHGKHIFTEKVLALTVSECKQIAETVAQKDIKFIISFPHRTKPDILFAKNVVDEGLLGQINFLRIRNAHDGASRNWLPENFYDKKACGGGAMIDLGAHGMYLAAWLLGKPKSISAVFNSFTNKPVEDNAVAIIEFKNKAIAVNETGFISPKSPFTLELYGTNGNLQISGPDRKLQLYSSKLANDVEGWVSPINLPQALPSAMEQWINGILTNSPIHFTMNDAIQLTELMEGAYRSHKEEKKIFFPL